MNLACRRGIAGNGADVQQVAGLLCFGVPTDEKVRYGDLYARSRPGKGATFVVAVPIVSEDQPRAEQTDLIQAWGV